MLKLFLSIPLMGIAAAMVASIPVYALGILALDWYVPAGYWFPIVGAGVATFLIVAELTEREWLAAFVFGGFFAMVTAAYTWLMWFLSADESFRQASLVGGLEGGPRVLYNDASSERFMRRLGFEGGQLNPAIDLPPDTIRRAYWEVAGLPANGTTVAIVIVAVAAATFAYVGGSSALKQRREAAARRARQGAARPDRGRRRAGRRVR